MLAVRNLFAAAAALIICSSESYPSPKATAADDVLEAVFRHMFERNHSVQQRTATVHCIKIADADPPDAFIERFAGITPPVRKKSACRWQEFDFVREKATGKPGLIFWVERPKWTAKTQAEVKGGYYEESLSASGSVYTVRWNGKGWVVVRGRLEWIS